MNFGFSYVGLIFLIMLMLPNIAWTKNQPKDYEKYVVNENKVLLALERIGEVLVSCAALIFSDFNFRPWSSRSFTGSGISEARKPWRTFTAVFWAYRLREQRCLFWPSFH